MDLLTIVLIIIGGIVGIVVGIIPVYLCFNFIKDKLSFIASPYIKGALTGFAIWLLIWPTYCYFDSKYKLFISDPGGDGLILFLYGSFSVIGFIISGLIAAKISRNRQINPNKAMQGLKPIFAAIIIILIFYMLVDFVFFPNKYDPITTKVVDADTGEPIDGAVIMAEWTNTKGIGLTYTVSYNVEEVVTDINGMARLEGIPAGKASLSVVAVYKKGYVLWSDHNVFAGSRMLTVFEWKDNYVFEMARFKPEYSYVKHESFMSSATRSGSGGYKPLIFEASAWEGKEASKERDKNRRIKR